MFNSFFKFIICLSISVTLFLLIYFFYYSKIQTVQVMLIGSYEIKNKPFIRSLNKSAFAFSENLGQENLNTIKYYIKNDDNFVNYSKFYNILASKIHNKDFLLKFYNKNKVLISNNSYFFENSFKNFLMSIKTEGYFRNRNENIYLYFHTINPDIGRQIINKLIQDAYLETVNEYSKFLENSIFEYKNFILNKIIDSQRLYKYLENLNTKDNLCFRNIKNDNCYFTFLSFINENIQQWGNDNKKINDINFSNAELDKLNDLERVEKIINSIEGKSDIIIKEILYELKESSILIQDLDIRKNILKTILEAIEKNLLFVEAELYKKGFSENYSLEDLEIFGLVNKDFIENYKRYSLAKFTEFFRHKTEKIKIYKKEITYVQYLMDLNEFNIQLKNFYNHYDYYLMNMDDEAIMSYIPYNEMILPSNLVTKKYNLFNLLFYSFVVTMLLFYFTNIYENIKYFFYSNKRNKNLL